MGSEISEETCESMGKKIQEKGYNGKRVMVIYRVCIPR
jgi:hypothetical protein